MKKKILILSIILIIITIGRYTVYRDKTKVNLINLTKKKNLMKNKI